MSESIALTLSAVFTNITSYSILSISFPIRYSRRRSAAAISVFLILFHTVLWVFGWETSLLGGFRSVVHIPLLLILYRGQFFQKIFAFIYIVMLNGLIMLFTAAIAGLFTEANSERFFALWILLLAVLEGGYLCTLFKLGRGFFGRLFVNGSRMEWALYSLGGLISLSVMALLVEKPLAAPHQGVVLFFIFWSFAILCYAIINTHEKTRQKINAEFAKSIVSSGRGHYQKMDEMYEKLRILRHDYKYHLNAARKMLRLGDADGADTYLTQVEDQLSRHELQKYCQNAVINALISSYAERCAALEIRFDVRLDMPEALTVSDYDICIIFGNLLENAVEACCRLDGARAIELSAQTMPARFLIMVRNSFDGDVRQDNGNPVSQKIGGGVGLRSVREVVARHSGDLLTEWDQETFTAYAAVRV
jgi:hypothetical protein